MVTASELVEEFDRAVAQTSEANCFASDREVLTAQVQSFGSGDLLPSTVEMLRMAVGLCPSGAGHWISDCVRSHERQGEDN